MEGWSHFIFLIVGVERLSVSSKCCWWCCFRSAEAVWFSLDMLLLGESVCWTVFEFQTEN